MYACNNNILILYTYNSIVCDHCFAYCVHMYYIVNICDRETERPRFEICVGSGQIWYGYYYTFYKNYYSFMYNIYYIFIHAENVGAFVLARGAFRAIHPIRTAIQRRRVWVGVTETTMCMYTSSRKSDVLFRWCCRCRFSDHPAVHKSRGIEADNSRAIPL